MTNLILQRLRQDDDVVDAVSPNFLARNWPPAFDEWSTRAVRDAFFASPQFPRLLKTDVLRETITLGVSRGTLAYVGKRGDGGYQPFHYNTTLSPLDVEISEKMFIITRETAEAYKRLQDAAAMGATKTEETPIKDGPSSYTPATASTQGALPAAIVGPPPSPPATQPSPSGTKRLVWSGEIPAQKWSNFYMKVLTKFAVGSQVKINLRVEVSRPDGISEQKIEETRVALRELGLGDNVELS